MDIFYAIIDFVTPHWMIVFISFLNGGLLFWRDRLGTRCSNKCTNYTLHGIGLILTGSFYVYIILGDSLGFDMVNHNSMIHFTIFWQMTVWLMSSVCDIRGAYGDR